MPSERPAAWRRVGFALFAVGWGGNQFSPMLVVYREELGTSPDALAATFLVYAAGLVVGLLLGGPASDRLGRRGPVLAFAALSPLATLVLMLAASAQAALWPARALAGLASGVVFAAGSAWIQELSLRREQPAVGSRRTALSLSAGFAAGPLVAAVIASRFAHPLVMAYVPHLAVSALALAAVAGAPETRLGERTGRTWARQAARALRPPGAARTRAWAVGIVPLAPWTFASASISFAVLPAFDGAVGVVEAGLLTAGTLAAGILAQPLARRSSATGAARIGLVATLVGLAVGVAALGFGAPGGLFAAAVPLGVGYGACLVAGLRRTEALAHPDDRGALMGWFYALTYLGFGAPLALGVLESVWGATAALALAAGLAVACLGVTAGGLRSGP